MPFFFRNGRLDDRNKDEIIKINDVSINWNQEVLKARKHQINLIKKDLFNLRFKKINGQLEDTSKILRLKRDLAKVMTNLNKKN